MACGNRQHPPKPGLAYRIAVTGHRPNRLSNIALEKINRDFALIFETVEAAVANIATRYGECFSEHAPQLSLLSSLAEGADRAAAKWALNSDFELDVVLPFSPEEYETDFVGAESLSEFRGLLGQAARVFILPDHQDDERTNAYEATARVFLDNSDLLIAVWDGAPSAGRGGTYDVMAMAVQRGMPLIVVDAQGKKPPMLRVPSQRGVTNDIVWFEDIPDQPMPQNLPTLIDAQLRPPEQPHLNDHYSEILPTKNLRFEMPLLMALFGVRSVRRTDFVPTTPDEITAAAQSQSNLDEKEAGLIFGWADALAIYHAQVFRSAIVANFALAASAVAMVPFSLLMKEVMHVVDVKWPFVLVEVMLISLLLLNTLAGQRINWHRRWIEPRELAERLRIALPMRLIGTRPIGPPVSAITWTSWLARATFRDEGLLPQKLTSAHLIEAQQRLVVLLHDQSNYHQVTAHRLHKLDHRLEKFGESLFFTTLVIAGGFLGATALKAVGVIPVITAEWKYAVAAFTVACPVIATATYGIRVICDFEGIAKRSKRMESELNTLIDEMDTQDKINIVTLRNHFHTAAAIMLGDVDSWRIAADGRGLAIPG